MKGLVALWVLWCSLHSLLITQFVSRWMERRGKAWQAWYRLAYVVFSGLSLLPILWYSKELPQQPLTFSWKGAPVVQGILLCYAVFMFLAGGRAYDLLTFVGIRQLQQYKAHQSVQAPTFRATGILRYVRHPWYAAGLALLWGLPGTTDVSLCIRILLSVYLLVGTLLEQRKLTSQFGQRYTEYSRQVPMLIPWKFWHEMANKKGKAL